MIIPDADISALFALTTSLKAQIDDLASESLYVRDQHREQLDALKLIIKDLTSAKEGWRRRAEDAEKALLDARSDTFAHPPLPPPPWESKK